MPYLDMGEFYSDFGSFDVTITLPANYIVGATGILETESEIRFLAQQARETTDYLSNGAEPSYEEGPFPPSSPERKTIRYTADRVHDFAWFADKRFRVQQSRVELPSGRKVDTWVMFTRYEQHLWKEAIRYVDRSLQFYSERVGEYPYPQATAVQSALSAGSGMEYPMITVIGPAGTAAGLDEVITHEIGHNWFYGILANNERRHPWMDEGINSYYEQRYMRKFYGASAYDDYLPAFFRAASEMDADELAYLYQARRDRDQAPDSPSAAFSSLNYYIGAYQKPAAAFRYLEHYLGTERFDAIMQAFFRQWQFRHPSPADLRAFLERESGENLAWLFDDLLFSNRKMDYALTRIDREEGGDFRITVKNKGAVEAPFYLSGLREDSVVYTEWYEGFRNADTFRFPAGNYDEIVVDALRLSPELYRQNNRIRTSGMLRRTNPIKLSFLPSLENDRRSQLYLLPVPGWNAYDQFMLGLACFNTVAPAKRFEWAVAPMYGFASKSLVGTGRLEYHLFPAGQGIRELTFGLGAKSFHDFRNDARDYDLRYLRLMPYLKLEPGKHPAAAFTQQFQWRTLWINREEAQFSDNVYTGKKWNDSFIHELSYAGINHRGVNPFALRLALEQQSYDDLSGHQHYLKASLEWNNSFSYREKKNIDLRLFSGFFLLNTKRYGGRIFPGAFNLIPQGHNDYRYDELYFARNEREGFWSQQIGSRDGLFKTPLGGAFDLGQSNNFILALNLKADLPVNLPAFFPLKPYFDLGYFDNAQPTGQDDTFQDQLLWSGGLMLDFFDGMASLNFPVINSKNIGDRLQERGNYWTRISFSIDFIKLNPFDLVKSFEF